jgi:glyoxylase I family protein
MKIEHFALNVEKPLEAGRWYVEHLGFTVKRRVMDKPWAHFLADESGTVMIEIYRNDSADVPDYRSVDPLVLHLAFVSDDIRLDLARLIKAGAKQEGELQELPSGDAVVFLRDPWGVPLQLVHRANPMI